MYYVLYIDVLFLQNLLLDYLLLTVTARLLKLSPGRIRRLLAAGLGSLLLCLVYALWPRCPLPVFLLLHGALAIIMSIAGLRIAVRSRTLLGRAVILLYLCSFLLGGIFGWIQGMIKFPVYPFLGLSLLSCWLLSLAARWLFRFRQNEQQICSVTLGFHGRILRLRGLRDTGNSLRDPIFGKPVSLLHRGLLEALCGTEEILYYPVPYRSVGKENGLLPAFYADFLQIETEDGPVLRTERPLLGVTKEPLSSKNEYDILLHPDLFFAVPENPQNEKASGRARRPINFSGGNNDNAD